MKSLIIKTGPHLAATLPKPVIDNFALEEGDELAVETQNGSITLTPSGSNPEEWDDAYRRANRAYRDVLKKLGK